MIKPRRPAPIMMKIQRMLDWHKRRINNFRLALDIKAMKKRNEKNYKEHLRSKKAKLHLGCGDDYRNGYINVDFYNKKYADKKWKLNDLKIPDDCCDRVESYAAFEHLNLIEFWECIEECRRVLRPGGVLVFEIPEFEEYIQLWLKQDKAAKWSFEWISPIWGGQWTDGQYHKAGYSFVRVKEILEEIGFENIVRKEPCKEYRPCVMQRVEATKKYLSIEDHMNALRKRSGMFESWGHHEAADSLLAKIDSILQKRAV